MKFEEVDVKQRIKLLPAMMICITFIFVFIIGINDVFAAPEDTPPPLPPRLGVPPSLPLSGDVPPPLPPISQPPDAPPGLPPGLPPTLPSDTPPGLPGSGNGNSGGGHGNEGAPPVLPGLCVPPPGDMPLTPDTCQLNDKMCGCEDIPHDPDYKPDRKRLSKNQLNSFPAVAPGLEYYKSSGYCTGINSGDTRSYSSNGSYTIQKGIRKYTLRLTQEIDPVTHRKFLKTTMDQYDEAKNQIIHCPTLSQHEPQVETKTRPINAPPLFFIEGETAEITVINDAPKGVNTSVHWHGIILPNDQDGIIGITQRPILSGERKVYKFKLEQNGTYWYHPHDLNEQDTKGAFIIFPDPNKPVKTEFGGIGARYHHDRIIQLTDYIDRDPLTILNLLRQGEDRNAYELDSRIHKGWLSSLECKKDYLENFKTMKMFWMDPADVWYDSFFMNDESCLNCGSSSQVDDPHREYKNQKFSEVKEFSQFKAGDRVRLRLINSSASSYFFIDYANSNYLRPNQKLDMMVVAKDGLPVKPIYVDQLYMGMGETYDVIVEVPDNGTLYELRAKSIDDITSHRVARVLIGNRSKNVNNTNFREDRIVSARNVPVRKCGYPDEPDQINQARYNQLQMRDSKVNARPDELRPFEVYHREKEIVNYHLVLSGSMDDYHWKIGAADGTKLESDSMNMTYLTIKEDKRIRVTIENTMMRGMMNHPWHLHGNWFRIVEKDDTDDDVAKKALLHTATILPGQKMTLEFYSDPEYKGAWMFHCHNLYHMANDMMIYLKYESVSKEEMAHRMGHDTNSFIDRLIPDALKGIKNQFIAPTVGTRMGTDGFAQTANLNYRGTLGRNLGYVDFRLNAVGSLNEGDKDLEINGLFKYFFETDKYVILDMRFKKSNQEGTTDEQLYLGRGYKPFNSDLVVLEAAGGAKCVENSVTKAINCKPAARANAGSTLDVGWNTKVSGQIGCEGEYCSEFYAQFEAKIKLLSHMTLIPIDCKLSSDPQETACMAEVQFNANPIPFGAQH